MPPDQQPDTSKRPMAIAVSLLGVGVAVVAVLLAPAGAGDRPSTEDAASSKAAPAAAGELVAGGANGGSAAPATPGAAGGKAGGNAPLTIDEEDDAKRIKPYTSDSTAVESTPAEQAAQAKAVAELERSTSGIHDCLVPAQAEHERKGGEGRVDPLQCVYDHTAMDNEQGRVRFDITTRDTFSYYVDVAGLRYRYTETDGNGCRSIDGVAGCAAW